MTTDDKVKVGLNFVQACGRLAAAIYDGLYGDEYAQIEGTNVYQKCRDRRKSRKNHRNNY